MTSEVDEYLEKNANPLQTQLAHKCGTWRTSINTGGKVESIKNDILAQILYFFQNTLSHVPKAFLGDWRKLWFLLCGLDNLPGWRKAYFISHYGGGVLLPNFQRYYWVILHGFNQLTQKKNLTKSGPGG